MILYLVPLLACSAHYCIYVSFLVARFAIGILHSSRVCFSWIVSDSHWDVLYLWGPSWEECLSAPLISVSCIQESTCQPFSVLLDKLWGYMGLPVRHFGLLDHRHAVGPGNAYPLAFEHGSLFGQPRTSLVQKTYFISFFSTINLLPCCSLFLSVGTTVFSCHAQ